MMGDAPDAILRRLIRRCAAPPAILAVLALVPTGFLLLELRRSYPFVDDFATYNHRDDWYIYRVLAESVLRDGWTIPAMPRGYDRPGGFLYVYFVAGVMSLLGQNSTKVYLVQSILLGLTAVVVYLGFGRRLSPGAGLVYLGTTVGFLYLDAFRHYTNRLLSENLVIILLPGALILLCRAGERPTVGRGAIAGLALGAVILCRPNLLPLGPAAAGLLVVFRRPGARTAGAAFAVLGGMLTVVGIMVLRNYVVTGAPSADVFTATRDWISPPIPTGAGPFERSWAALVHYGRRALFMFGWPTMLEPAYRLRPHWLLMWAGVAVFGVTICRHRVAFWEALLVMSVIVCVVPLLAVAHIANYGFRMFVPVVPLALLLAVRGIERWRSDEPSIRPRE